MPVRRKQSNSAQTPPGSPNSLQGVSVKGTSTGESASHPTLTWVVS